MKKGGGKHKGGNFEREICKKLSLWLTNGEDDRICWRTSSSGGTSTNLAKKGKKTSFLKKNLGDITQTVDKGEYPEVDNFFDAYIVECKAYKSIDFYPPVRTTLKKFLDQCIKELTDAYGQDSKCNKAICLIVEANSKETLFITNSLRVNYKDKAYVMSFPYSNFEFAVYLLDDLIKAE